MLRVHYFPKKLATLPDGVALWVQASKTVESQNGAWIQFGSGPPPSENLSLNDGAIKIHNSTGRKCYKVGVLPK